MPRLLVPGGLGAATALLVSACVTAPPANAPAPPRVSMMADDGRAQRYGARPSEMFGHPALRDKLVALFGSDWDGAARGGRVTIAAADFFATGSPPRLVRIDEQTYIAVMGCAANGCSRYRGLVLIREDGAELLSRLDEGGFSHYYGHGAEFSRAAPSQTLIDGAWRALNSPG